MRVAVTSSSAHRLLGTDLSVAGRTSFTFCCRCCSCWDVSQMVGRLAKYNRRGKERHLGCEVDAALRSVLLRFLRSAVVGHPPVLEQHKVAHLPVPPHLALLDQPSLLQDAPAVEVWHALDFAFLVAVIIFIGFVRHGLHLSPSNDLSELLADVPGDGFDAYVDRYQGRTCPHTRPVSFDHSSSEAWATHTLAACRVQEPRQFAQSLLQRGRTGRFLVPARSLVRALCLLLRCELEFGSQIWRSGVRFGLVLDADPEQVFARRRERARASRWRGVGPCRHAIV